jgi:predicted outer membrane repeat protein
MVRLSALALTALAGTSLAQSVFVDMNMPAGAGTGAPASPYGAASGLLGVWNSITPSGAPGGTTVPVLNTDFTNTGVTVKHHASSGGSSASSGTGDFSKLMADYAGGFGATGQASMEFANLQPGLYRVWVYAGLPMSLASYLDGFATIYHPNNISVGISGFVVGTGVTKGHIDPGSFARAKNFEVFTVYVPSSAVKLQILTQCDPNYASARTALNGVQLEKFQGSRLYVNDNAVGKETGHSWPDAMSSLPEALEIARISAGQITEIWVASGVYKPGTNRADTFKIPSGVKLYGGFAGSETSLSQRTLAAGPSVLTGAIGDFSSDSDNSLHVVDASNTNSATRLDGFSMSYGYAGGLDDQSRGAGMIADNANLTVANCSFGYNYASIEGAGVHVSGASSPKFINCDFAHNTAGRFGAALRNTSTLTVGVVNSRFLKNEAGLNGGAINSTGSFIFGHGCVFNSNFCYVNGGAVYVFGAAADSVFRSCTFAANHAQMWGGVGAAEGAQTDVINSIAWANSDDSPNTSLEREQVGGSANANVVVLDNILQGCLLGNGNRNLPASPSFIDMNGPDDIQGNDDDDLRLSPGSPAIDSGNNTLAPFDQFDIDSDLDTFEVLPSDAAGNPRLVDAPEPDTGIGASPIIDRGAYEFQTPPPVCRADFNGDNTVDFFDYLDFARAFDAGDSEADFNWDESVDFFDYLDFAAAFDAGC